MNAEPGSNSKSHAMGWTVSMLIALPVLYVLLTPPMIYTGLRLGVIPPVIAPPPWMQLATSPYDWLGHYETLRKPLDTYEKQWAKVLGL